jgi:hypothetical protein
MGSDKLLPPSKENPQVCGLHAMVCNDILVSIDTSVDDPNTRISNPNGLLPAPGFARTSAYPKGVRTTPQFLKIPNERLSPRCIHGQPFAGMGVIILLLERHKAYYQTSISATTVW